MAQPARGWARRTSWRLGARQVGDDASGGRAPEVRQYMSADVAHGLQADLLRDRAHLDQEHVRVRAGIDQALYVGDALLGSAVRLLLPSQVQARLLLRIASVGRVRQLHELRAELHLQVGALPFEHLLAVSVLGRIGLSAAA